MDILTEQENKGLINTFYIFCQTFSLHLVVCFSHKYSSLVQSKLAYSLIENYFKFRIPRREEKLGDYNDSLGLLRWRKKNLDSNYVLLNPFYMVCRVGRVINDICQYFLMGIVVLLYFVHTNRNT